MSLLSNLSIPTCNNILADFTLNRHITVEESYIRGKAAAAFEGVGLPLGAGEWVCSHLEKVRKEDTEAFWITRQFIRDLIWDQFNVWYSVRTITTLIGKRGISYERLKRPVTGAVSASRLEWLRRFVIIVDSHVAKGHHLGNQVESCANQHLQQQGASLAPKGGHFSKYAPTSGGGLGQRVCWVHVLIDIGFLGGDLDLPKVGDDLTILANTLMIFMAKREGSEGGYHGNFDSLIMAGWRDCRLIPALKHFFPACVGPDATESCAIILTMLPTTLVLRLMKNTSTRST